MLARQVQETRTGVNAHVLGSRAGNHRSEHTLTRPHVENAFSWPRFEQSDGCRNRDLAVVLASAFSYPAVIPIRQRVPTGLRGRTPGLSTWRFTVSRHDHPF